MPTINRLAYSNSFLKSLNNSNYPFQPDVQLQSTLNDIMMCRKRTKRGCRGGMNLDRKIQVVKPFKRLPQQPPVNERGVNPFNLTQIKPVASASSHRHFKCEFPTFFLSNAQSVVNKLDEFELLLHQESVDVAVIRVSVPPKHTRLCTFNWRLWMVFKIS